MGATLSTSSSNRERWRLGVTFTPLERAFVAYYAHRYGSDLKDVVRGMVRKYVEADRNFDAKAFAKYVKNVLLPEEKDKAMREDLAQQVEQYRKGAGKR